MNWFLYDKDHRHERLNAITMASIMPKTNHFLRNCDSLSFTTNLFFGGNIFFLQSGKLENQITGSVSAWCVIFKRSYDFIVFTNLISVD